MLCNDSGKELATYMLSLQNDQSSYNWSSVESPFLLNKELMYDLALMNTFIVHLLNIDN
jgi:hypothetical protein